MKNLWQKFKMYGLKRFLFYALLEAKNIVFGHLILGSYSQRHEDLVIDKLLRYKINGFYVDIGAYDPRRFSNTKRFYLKGWRGINIEPDKVNFQKFIKQRPEDINLNFGVSDCNSKLTFYKFIPDTLSTFSKSEAAYYTEKGYKQIGQETVQVKKAAYIFQRYCPTKNIDFLSIDTEGLELEVLRGNNWRKFKPSLICIETKHNQPHSLKINEKIEIFLSKKGYRKIIDNNKNSIYQLDQKVKVNSPNLADDCYTRQ